MPKSAVARNQCAKSIREPLTVFELSNCSYEIKRAIDQLVLATEAVKFSTMKPQLRDALVDNFNETSKRLDEMRILLAVKQYAAAERAVAAEAPAKANAGMLKSAAAPASKARGKAASPRKSRRSERG